MSFRELLYACWEDSRRKRRQMGRPTTRLAILRGLLSINCVAITLWRFSMYFMDHGWRIPAMLLYYVNIVLFGFDGSPYARVGPGLVIGHLVGCIIHGKIGKNVTLFGRIGIGGRGEGDTGGWRGGPILEDYVTMGFGAVILTDQTVGAHATLGAGSYCFKSVPSGAVMLGTPARRIRTKSAEEIAREKDEPLQ